MLQPVRFFDIGQPCPTAIQAELHIVAAVDPSCSPPEAGSLSFPLIRASLPAFSLAQHPLHARCRTAHPPRSHSNPRSAARGLSPATSRPVQPTHPLHHHALHSRSRRPCRHCVLLGRRGEQEEEAGGCAHPVPLERDRLPYPRLDHLRRCCRPPLLDRQDGDLGRDGGIRWIRVHQHQGGARLVRRLRLDWRGR